MELSWDNYVVPDNYELFEHLAYASDDESQQFLNLSIPRNRKNFPTLIWFHGGGMNHSAIDFVPELWDGTFAVAAARYRLAPQAMPPAQYEDAAMAIDYVCKNIASYGGDPSRIIVGGLSAGANMAALTVFDEKWLKPYNLSYRNFLGVMLISGQMTTHFYVKELLKYPGANPLPVIDELAPMYHLKADLPPIMLLAGERDMPGRMYENLFMRDTLRALGHNANECHIIPGARHGANLLHADIMLDFIHRIID